MSYRGSLQTVMVTFFVLSFDTAASPHEDYVRITYFNPIALRTAKTPYIDSFGRSECNSVKVSNLHVILVRGCRNIERKKKVTSTYLKGAPVAQQVTEHWLADLAVSSLIPGDGNLFSRKQGSIGFSFHYRPLVVLI